MTDENYRILHAAASEALLNLDTFFGEGEAEELDYADHARDVLVAALRQVPKP